MNHWSDSPKQWNSDWREIQRRRYGVISVDHQGTVSLGFRWWPKRVSVLESRTLGAWRHASPSRIACRLYYSQPLGSDQYLVLTYMVSSKDCRFECFRAAVNALDQIAFIKQSDAILCQVINPRISARLLARWGWERRASTADNGQWIKRFYGDYSRVSLSGQAPTASAAE